MCIEQRRNRELAFTITELWMAIAVASIVMAGLMTFSVYAARSFAGITNYVDLEQKSQNALDTMTRDVRQTQYLISYDTTTLDGRTITNQLTFMDYDGQPLSYGFTNNVFVRSKAGESTVLLTNVDFLTFQIFQRNPINGTYEQYPTASATNCKLISVSWICSRSILGSRLNTGSVQTAKVIIRKQ